jgi:hypothetical protein
MNLDWLEAFADPYLKTPVGQGVFLSGIVLGIITKYQVSKGESIDSAPMFKQLMFGKMQRRDLLRHLSRVPELIRAYDIPYKNYVRQLSGKAGELLLESSSEMGVDGNFAFSVAYLNAYEYFWKIFGKQDNENQEIERSE